MSEIKNTEASGAAENAGTADAEKITPKKPNRKKLIIIIVVAAIVLIAAGAILFAVLNGNSENAEADEDIEYINVQSGNYYGGIVEPQQTSDVAKDPERTIKEIHVKVGDVVKKGDTLFEYDSNETETKLNKAKIEYEGIQNDIAECNNSISQLSRARSQADAEQQLEYTEQIQEKESSKSQLELSLKIKQVEIDNLQENLNNSVVTSPIDGIIKQINNSTDSSNSAFMTVLMNGSFRVKGQVDEMNVRSLQPDMPVTVHSRVVKDKTWKGTITKVDTGKTADRQGGAAVDNGSSDNSASKYNFYVSLDSSDGLLLGEHVYIETEYQEPAEESAEQADAPAETEAAEN